MIKVADFLFSAFASLAFAVFIWNDGSVKWALVVYFIAVFLGYMLKAFNAFLEPIVDALKGAARR